MTRTSSNHPLHRALLVALTPALLGVGACASGPDGVPATPAPSTPSAARSVPSSVASRSSTSPIGTPTEPSGTASAAGSQVTVPVYLVADVPGMGPRLYREFHRVALPPNGSRLQAALTDLLRGTPIDPDYRSPWPAGTTLRSVTVASGTATVDLDRWGSWGVAFEQAAVESMVHTATAADAAVVRVLLRVNGGTPPSGHLQLDTPITRGDPVSVLSHVWILTPAQGASVSSPVTITAYGTGYEGNTPLQIFRGSTRVWSGYLTTSMGQFAQGRTTVTLPPGQYELRAFTDNGENATLQPWDTKTFVVR